jgi:hypothetical protein
MVLRFNETVCLVLQTGRLVAGGASNVRPEHCIGRLEELIVQE